MDSWMLAEAPGHTQSSGWITYRFLGVITCGVQRSLAAIFTHISCPSSKVKIPSSTHLCNIGQLIVKCSWKKSIHSVSNCFRTLSISSDSVVYSAHLPKNWFEVTVKLKDFFPGKVLCILVVVLSRPYRLYRVSILCVLSRSESGSKFRFGKIQSLSPIMRRGLLKHFTK